MVQRLVADLTKHWCLHLLRVVQTNFGMVMVVIVLSCGALKVKSKVKGEEDLKRIEGRGKCLGEEA